MAKETSGQGIAYSALAFGTKVKGDIYAEGDFRIDGQIEGNIECVGKVVVGSKAEVRGHIKCDSAELLGKIEGNIFAGKNVSLKHSCSYQGSMVVQTLDIEPGAVFNGTCKMIGDKD